eukprot:SAG22_NODE_12798_length_429_cov_0.700000_1_plen_68_part_01
MHVPYTTAVVYGLDRAGPAYESRAALSSDMSESELCGSTFDDAGGFGRRSHRALMGAARKTAEGGEAG